MQVTSWKKEELTDAFANCENLKDIIDSLEKQHMENDEVICEIRVNGMFLTSDDEERLGSALIQEIDNLEISTNQTNQLIYDSVNAIVTWIPNIKKSAVKSADLFRDGAEPGTQKFFSDTLESCQWLTDALTHLKLFLTNRAGQEGFEKDWEKNEVFYKAVIKELLASYQSQDYVRLSDCLEYDLTTILDKWLELLATQVNIKQSDAE